MRAEVRVERRWLAAALAGVIALITAGAIAGLRGLRLVAKPAPVLFLAWRVARRAEPSVFRTRMLAALLLCAVGDVILDTGRFVPGLVAFLLGHLAYLAAFVGESRAVRPLAAAPFVLWGGGAIALLSDRLGAMAAPVTAYTATICVMMWRAIALVGPARPWATSIAVGAVLFGASDTMIAIDRFHTPLRGARVLILALYWIGQFFIARGAIARRALPAQRVGQPAAS